MGLFDALKIPDLAQWGERITVFINAANAKLEAQTDAIRTLANFVRQVGEDMQKQRAILAQIEKRLGNEQIGRLDNGGAGFDNGAAGAANAAGNAAGIFSGDGPGNGGDMAG
jgi:hypothetical protein